MCYTFFVPSCMLNAPFDSSRKGKRMLLAGQQIAHYRLLRLIGSGGMGEVYLAADMAVERQVAIKVIRTDISLYSTQEEFRAAVRLFNREANAIARLDHPHILPLFECGEERLNGTTFTYLVMPYRPEGSLADLFRRRKHPKQFLPQDVAHIILQAADALEHAHIHQIIHRDVKPSNFLLRHRNEASGRPDLLLTDFGIAKLSTTSDDNTGTTIRGTATYMAPEQWEDHPVPETDQYALAVMAYELLTGQPPFLGNQQQLMYQHFHVQPKPPGTINPHISKDIDAVVLRALSKKPVDRFASISAFAHAFQEAIQEGSNIRLTLTVSQLEALTGTTRTLLFSEGRQVTVSVPAGATEGQVIRLEGQGRPPQFPGDLPGALILTISIIYVEEEMVSLANSQTIESTIPAINPNNFDPNDDIKIIKPDRNRIRAKSILLIAIVLLVIAGGFGLYYGADIRPKELEQANATGTSQAQHTATAYSATGAAQLNATATSQAYATATAQSQATATAIAAITATARAQVTATAGVFPTAASGKPSYQDNLNDPNKLVTQAANWDQNGNCFFASDGYHVIEGNNLHGCKESANRYQNVAISVNMSIISGYSGGLFFRINTNIFDQYAGYLFEVDSAGRYRISMSANYSNSITPLQDWTASTALQQGDNVTNTLQVIAHGSNLLFYANGVFLAQLTDINYTSAGAIGFLAKSDGTPTEVVYSNLSVYPQP